MEKKNISFADVSRSLNRMEGFIDDFLLTVQSYNEKRIIKNANVIVDGHEETIDIYPIDIKKSIMGFIDDVKFNREGDESINYYGIHDCVDYILNNQSLPLAKRAFSIESKINEAEQILLSFLSKIGETSDLLWQTGQILWQIGELHIEPFVVPETGDNEQIIQGTNQAANNPIPETGENESLNTKKVEPLNKAQVMMAVKNEPFAAKEDGRPIPYKKCFERLTMGKIRRSVGKFDQVEVIDKQYDYELFKYCVDRANIKYLIKEKKCFAYLFLRCISEYFENPLEYRKVAAMSFGIKTICSVGGDTKSDFYNLFSGIFKNEDIPRTKRK